MIRKTSIKQAQRKKEGTELEKMVMDDLINHNIEISKIYLNTHEGVDIYLTDGKVINVEVKSAKALEYYNYKVKGVTKEGVRSGRFYLKEEDYLASEIFAFIVKPVDKKLNWDRRKPIEIWYVDSNDIRNYLKENNLFRTYKSVKINMDVVRNMPRVDPSEIFLHRYC